MAKLVATPLAMVSLLALLAFSLCSCAAGDFGADILDELAGSPTGLNSKSDYPPLLSDQEVLARYGNDPKCHHDLKKARQMEAADNFFDSMEKNSQIH